MFRSILAAAIFFSSFPSHASSILVIDGDTVRIAGETIRILAWPVHGVAGDAIGADRNGRLRWP